ncbi:helix-turn-helix transcriptional regulator [Mobiluncus mulieris]|uniref:Transcriptional regulator, LuxR family n=2 Tax=Mobiluncus mulieris TaxID=2052 RepID=E0QQM1_9ACTO|nr:LuxR C-terminal-related transcriptional regulator [Mobiluncus mulieris]EFM46194.1 transcriptional regulator, LuxR family [Mobiluncus mulieris ATCC 35239]MCU9971631.1 helix-turn-helix transcriptional regulator [Mobiluncus mulieris]MCU9976182.1 helix-turn-helix transcriptional regulator [Mobiluncus mulieris]MCU9994901.1 helix-turn-helix transcriptional regulator [Mobiluncus mulieris]MCU9997334.1 helix-turn-helix transcriptional regulator [Mobiluncus mulieris]
MITWLFYYTLAVLLLSIFAGAVSFSAYTVSRRKTYLGATLFSVVYFFDMALVLRPSIVNDSLRSQVVDYFTITSPPESILFGCCLIALIWYVAFAYLGLRPFWIAIPPLIFVILSVVILLTIQNHMWREFAFFSMRAVGFLSLPCFLLVYYFAAKNGVKRLMIKKYRALLVTSCILCLGTVEWNIYFMILAPDYLRASRPFLPERNFMENIFLLFVAWWIAFRGVGILRLHINQPPTELNRDEEVINSEAALFSRRHKLSPTENRVLARMVQGDTNQQIADLMFIELATVKVHVHNILKKTGKSNRTEVISEFWHSL